jgi:hypothetical protein
VAAVDLSASTAARVTMVTAFPFLTALLLLLRREAPIVLLRFPPLLLGEEAPAPRAAAGAREQDAMRADMVLLLPTKVFQGGEPAGGRVLFFVRRR